MKSLYLRVEGVNLSNFISDTQDLSTIRGGSLLLLEAIERIEKRPELESITTGASSGLFRVKVEDEKSLTTLATKIEEDLNKDPQLKHATFVVDTLAVEGGTPFWKVREQLIALNRWRQVQSPTVAIPGEKNSRVVCQLDKLRPAADERFSPDGNKISESVYQRRMFGREQKRREFYAKQTGLNRLPFFVNEFSELTKIPAADGTNRGEIDDSISGALTGKMAVIYLDGNRFGALQEALCKRSDDGAERQNAFDNAIKSYRKSLLRRLLETTVSRPEWTFENKHRMETLLWGGDELIWVVPAWLGWWTLGFFFRFARHWRFDDQRLTHAAGLVFCHYNAPIHRVTDLARQLGELAKAYSREGNYVAYQILESFDHAGLDLEEIRAKRCPPGVAPFELILDGERLLEAGGMPVADIMRQIRIEFPKRRLHRLIQELAETPAQYKTLEKNAMKELRAPTLDALEELRDCFGHGTGFWLHLTELWDYVV